MAESDRQQPIPDDYYEKLGLGSSNVGNAGNFEPLIKRQLCEFEPLPVDTLERILRYFNQEQKIQLDEGQLLNVLAIADNERRQFGKATEVLAINGIFGLGDAIIQARHIRFCAEQTEKRFICQIPPALIGCLTNTSNISYVPIITSRQLKSANKFLFSIGFSQDYVYPSEAERLSNPWFDPTKIRLPKIGLQLERLIQTQQSSQFWKGCEPADINDVITALKQLNYIGDDAQALEAYYQLRLHLLGVSQEQYQPSTSLLILSEAEIIAAKKKYHYDLLIFPDAQEKELYLGEDQVRQSGKSLFVDQWEEIFPRLKGLNMGIVKGTAHPDYCQLVITKALKAGCQVNIVEVTTMAQLIPHMLAAKNIFGMDSGTTHLAAEVIKAVKNYGLSIQLLVYFNGIFADFNQYAITDLENQSHSLVYDIKGDISLKMDVSNLQIPTELVQQFLANYLKIDN